MLVNLGCGKRKMPGWINVDSQKYVEPDECFNIKQGLSFADNSIDVFNARAILEHIDKALLIPVMSEIHRCLKPGGLFYVMVPNWNQKWMWSDPTHHTGWSREMMDWFIGKSKPSEIGIDFKFEELHYEELLFPNAQQVADELNVDLDFAKRHLANTVDAHIWWLKKPGECGMNWKKVRDNIRDMNIYPNGYSSQKPILRTSQKIELIPSRPQMNKLLWFINVAWVGGTALWALEAIQNMPNWSHTICYVNGQENPEISERFRNLGCDFSKAGEGVTRRLVESINPSAIILSNTNPRQIEDWQNWVDNHVPLWITQNYYVVYVHHSAVTPWLPASDIDVFVSKYLMSLYNNILEKKWIRLPLIVPTGIHVQPFLSNKLKKRKKDNVVVGRLATDSPEKFPKDFLKMMKSYGGKVEIVGGDKYYPNPRVKRVTYLDFNAMTPEKYMARWDVFVYKTAPGNKETWGRVIAEAMASGIPVVAENKGGIPELVEDGKTGFLCNTDNEFISKLKLLQGSPKLRIEMGEAGRERIKEICLKNPFVNVIEPRITKHVLMG